MASSLRIILKFVVRHFIFYFFNCNNSENLLTSYYTYIKRLLYDSSIIFLREEC